MTYKPLSDEEAEQLGRELYELTILEEFGDEAAMRFPPQDIFLIPLGRAAYKLVHRIDEGRE